MISLCSSNLDREGVGTFNKDMINLDMMVKKSVWKVKSVLKVGYNFRIFFFKALPCLFYINAQLKKS